MYLMEMHFWVFIASPLYSSTDLNLVDYECINRIWLVSSKSRIGFFTPLCPSFFI
jgi:hypothetical protein